MPRQSIAKVRTEGFYGGEAEVPTYEETLPGGVKHTIIQIQGDTGFNSNTQVFEVPPGQYFMMGDNRDNSTDSRVPLDQGGVGYVPGRNIIGYVAIHAGEWEKPWSSVKGEAAKHCAKIFGLGKYLHRGYPALDALCFLVSYVRDNPGNGGDIERILRKCRFLYDVGQLSPLVSRLSRAITASTPSFW